MNNLLAISDLHKALLRLPAACLLALVPLAAPAQEAATPAAAEALPAMADIEAAWNREDFATVRAGLARLAAETGTPLAQYRYGRVLLEGRGGARDIPAAITWLEQAVAQDHLEASALLARIFLSGETLGLQRDPARAAALLQRAAARGNRDSQYYLGLLYREGDGIAKDPEAAATWLLAAAEAQHTEAQFALAQAYGRGESSSASPAAALRWLTAAAENGHRQAQFSLALAYDTGQGAARNPNEALRWYRAAAKQGLPVAQRSLGTRYLTGEGAAQDGAEALRWLTAAAGAGDPGAMSNLGYAYASGKVLPRDDALAAQWYQRAADAGVAGAALALGRFYETGRGVPQDLEQAVALYRAAAGQQAPGATARLARLAASGALDGLAPPHDMVPWVAAEAGRDATALAWLQARAAEGLRPAQTALARHYVQTGGDTAAAADLYKAAAEAGDSTAQLALGLLHSTGNGAALDYVAAHKWLNIAAAGGAAGAAQKRQLVAKLMTPEQIAEAQGAARAFIENAQPPVVSGQ